MTRKRTHFRKTDPGPLRRARELVRRRRIPDAEGLTALTLNPALELVADGAEPEREPILVWRSPADGRILAEPARPTDLLALKIVAESLDPEAVAAEAAVAPAAIDAVLQRAIERGILLKPPSRLRRPPAFHDGTTDPHGGAPPEVFTLQWHITQECDLACRHCYDRSRRRAVTREEGFAILDQLYDFCRARFVLGQVSFSGGNPFLHPDFTILYRAAAERGFATAILGNPVPRERLGEILDIRRPAYFQVSLEGLEEHNDHIRGAGHFRRTLAFLDLLRARAVPSEVMLTLTRDNLGQVLPLARILRGRADAFTFNRLVPFGEGASLAPAPPADYAAFLRDYLAAAEENPVLALKDSLLNIVLQQQGRETFGGCAGYGCGAAFNFVALLPDGEVHACRKFPSPIGNLHTSTLAGIYDSPAAGRYRAGSGACSGCPLKPVCGGCPAVTAASGGDPAEARDPFCFIPCPSSPLQES